MKLTWDSIQWGPYEFEGSIEYQYYFYWWNWLPKKSRYWGYDMYFYDHPMPHFGFWFINWSWFTQWTPWPKD